jgi:hypothetical protein
MKNQRFSKNRQKKPKIPGKNFSSNMCPIILDVLFVVKNSIDSVAPSSRFENRQKEGGVPLIKAKQFVAQLDSVDDKMDIYQYE